MGRDLLLFVDHWIRLNWSKQEAYIRRKLQGNANANSFVRRDVRERQYGAFSRLQTIHQTTLEEGLVLCRFHAKTSGTLSSSGSCAIPTSKRQLEQQQQQLHFLTSTPSSSFILLLAFIALVV
jgi:hypothetical protein